VSGELVIERSFTPKRLEFIAAADENRCGDGHKIRVKQSCCDRKPPGLKECRGLDLGASSTTRARVF